MAYVDTDSLSDHPRSQALLAACVAISPGTNRMQKQFDWSFEYDGMWLFECEVSD